MSANIQEFQHTIAKEVSYSGIGLHSGKDVLMTLKPAAANTGVTFIRVGFGYDVHRLVEGRELWLGGIKLEHTMGLLGHSDADVLIHALCDALLGAANMRDIGYHFPDTSADFKGIDSKILLRHTMELIRSKGYEFGNADITVAAERPKLNPHILLRYINKIAEKTGNSFMVDNNVPPHMTISAIEARSENVLLGAMERLSGQSQTFRDRLQALNDEKIALEAERTAKNKQSQEMNENLLDLERVVSKLEQKKATGAMEEKQILQSGYPKHWGYRYPQRISIPFQRAQYQSPA